MNVSGQAQTRYNYKVKHRMDLELILALPVLARGLGPLSTVQWCTLLLCIQYISISPCRRKTATLHANLGAQNILHNGRLYFR